MRYVRFSSLYSVVIAGICACAMGIPLKALGEAVAEIQAGEVVSVEGVVFIRQDQPNNPKAPHTAQAGDKILSGDVINTSSNGKVKVLFKDKSIIDLGPSALFKVDQFKGNQGTDRQIDVSMMYGTMRTAVTQKITGAGRFKVRTPTATMGVRGTEFIVKSEVKNLAEVRQVLKAPEKTLTPSPAAAGTPAISNAKTEITVLQGQVDVAKKEAPGADRRPASAGPEKVVSLTAGMQIATQTGDAQLAKPVKLDSQQLASVASVAKVQDNTFQKAVQIDFGSNAPGAGDATRAILNTTVMAPNVVPINVVEFIPGAEPPPPSQVPYNPQAGLRKLRVIVVTQ